MFPADPKGIRESAWSFAGAVRLKPLGLNADGCRRGYNKGIEPGMPSASPWKADFLLYIERGRGPLNVLTTRKRRKITRSIEEETEGVCGEGGRGFRAVELPACDFIARRVVVNLLDLLARNPGQESLSHESLL